MSNEQARLICFSKHVVFVSIGGEPHRLKTKKPYLEEGSLVGEPYQFRVNVDTDDLDNYNMFKWLCSELESCKSFFIEQEGSHPSMTTAFLGYSFQFSLEEGHMTFSE